MGAQQHGPAQVKRVLGVEGRVILGEVEGEKVVPFGFGLGTHGARESELAKDLTDLVHDLGDEVEPALPAGAAGHGEVHARDRAGGALEVALAGFEGGLELALQGVRRRADFLLGGWVELGQAPENLGERAGFASQDLGLEIGKPALVRLRNLLQTLPQLGEGCQEVAHDQSACLATSASCSNATGSRTARSARTLRLISTPALRSPFMRRL